MKHPIEIRDKKVKTREKYLRVRPERSSSALPLSTGQHGAVPVRPDLRRPVLRPPLADLRVQPGAENCPLQRRLPGPEAGETLPGQRKHLPCEQKPLFLKGNECFSESGAEFSHSVACESPPAGELRSLPKPRPLQAQVGLNGTHRPSTHSCSFVTRSPTRGSRSWEFTSPRGWMEASGSAPTPSWPSRGRATESTTSTSATSRTPYPSGTGGFFAVSTCEKGRR